MNINDPEPPAAETTAAFIRAHHANEAKQRIRNATQRTAEATRALGGPAMFSANGTALGTKDTASEIHAAERLRQTAIAANRPVPLDQLVEQQRARGDLAKSETTDPWAPALELLKRARGNGTTPGDEMTKARGSGSLESVRAVLEQSHARLERDVLGLLARRQAARRPARSRPTPLAKAADQPDEDEIVMVMPADAAIRIIRGN